MRSILAFSEGGPRSRAAALLVLWPLLALAAGCAGTTRTAAPASRLAILPLRAIGLGPAEVATVRLAMSRELARQAVAMASDREVEKALAANPECRELAPERQDPCAILMGVRLGASQVLTGAVGGIGRTYVVQLRLLQVSNAAVRTLEETLFGDLRTLTQAVGPIAARLFNPPRSRPWYTRWWIWTLVGAVVTGVAVAVPLLVMQRGEPFVEVPLP